MVFVPDLMPTFIIDPGLRPNSAGALLSTLTSWMASTGKIVAASPEVKQPTSFFSTDRFQL